MHNQALTEPTEKEINCINCIYYWEHSDGRPYCYLKHNDILDYNGCEDYEAKEDYNADAKIKQIIKQYAPDPINHPAHYETGKFECFDVMIETQGKEAVLNFCICNAFKYIYRFRNKGGDEDIKKANWYLSKYLELRDSE